RIELRKQLVRAFKAVPAFAEELGLDPKQSFEVHELRAAMRVDSEGKRVPQVVVALTQSRRVKEDEKAGTPTYIFRGGSTLVVDLLSSEAKYRIVKNIASENRKMRTANFIREATADPLRSLFFAPNRQEPFAALHSLADGGV